MRKTIKPDHNFQRPLSVLLFLILTLLLAAGDPSPVLARKFGHVAARGRVLGPEGKPIWVEFDESGAIVQEIGEAHDDPLENARVISADAYRSYAQAYTDVQDQYGPVSEVLTRQEYEERAFTRPDGTAIAKPALKSTAAAVVVRDQALAANAGLDLLLHESPISLKPLASIPDTARAVLISEQGQVIHTAEVNIGYRTAFYTLKNSTEHEVRPNNPDWQMGEFTMSGFEHGSHQLWGPIAGAEVCAGGFHPDITDNDGYFEADNPIGVDYYLMAKLRYQVFDPQSHFAGTYLRSHRLYQSFTGRNYWIKFPIDVVMVAGRAVMRGPAGNVPQGETTTYAYVPPAFDPEPAEPHRVADTPPDFNDQGLLAAITKEDMDDTDIYIYRMSNDQLVTSREGLGEHEFVPLFGAGQNDGMISFHMLIRGSASIYGEWRGTLWNLDKFQETTNVNQALRGQGADDLRLGEQLKVIIVNRATGYIGTAVGTIGSQVKDQATGKEVQGSDITLNLPRIYLQPPNLKGYVA